MQPFELKPNHIVTGPLLPEPVKIITLVPMGDSIMRHDRLLLQDILFHANKGAHDSGTMG